VSGLAGEFSGRVVGKNEDATTDANKKIVSALGFESHGLVIRSARGDVLWKQADHDVKMDDVRAALRNLLKDRK
jgi:hypothetical protein